MEPQFYLTDIDCNQPPKRKLQLRTRIQTLNQNVWKKTLARLAENLKSEEYYEGKRLRPGISFFKILLEAHETNSPSIQSVRANIPETMCAQSNRYNIVHTKAGQLHRLVEASFQEFERLVVPVGCPNHQENRYSQPQSTTKEKLSDWDLLHSLPELPLFVSRLGTGISFTKHIINAGEYRLKALPTSENELYQRYVIPYQFRANLVRLHFFTRNSREQQKSKGWKLINNNVMFDPKDIKKSITSTNLTVNFDREGSFECIEMRGKSLQQYEIMAESVITFLEECKDIVVREAVFDFTVDFQKTPWLLGLKMVRYDSRTSLPVCLTEEQKARQTEQITFSVTCRLCGIFFHKDSVNKMLTYKLLTQLVQHLKKRNKRLCDITLTDSSTRYCKVCNLCYSLVVAQHNLINVEQEMSIAQGIIEGEQLLRIGGVPRNRQYCSMLQWRMMLYVEQINDVQLPSWDTEKIYFQFKIHNFRTKFPVKTLGGTSRHSRLPRKERPLMSATTQTKTSVMERDESTWQFTKSNCKTISGDDLENLQVKRIKVQYFFSKSADIAGFLSETELKFRLTRTSDWNDFFAEGDSRTINHFNNKLKQGQRHSGEILLFFADMKHAKLQLHMGLVCDGAYSTDGIPLTQVNGVYFPTETYYNCNPFPEVWMEIFEDEGGLQSLRQDSQQSQLEPSLLQKIDYRRFDCPEARKVRRMLAS